jgi:hypothetical protein
MGLAEGLENLLEDPAFDPETLDHATRHRISEAARRLSLYTETPGDTVHRIAHTVGALQATSQRKLQFKVYFTKFVT